MTELGRVGARMADEAGAEAREEEVDAMATGV